MYVTRQESGEIEEMTEMSSQWVEQAIRVFDGEFTIDSDKMKIVNIVLGLWAHTNLELLKGNTSTIAKLILDNREAVFPREYFFHLVDILDELLETKDEETEALLERKTASENEGLRRGSFRGSGMRAESPENDQTTKKVSIPIYDVNEPKVVRPSVWRQASMNKLTAAPTPQPQTPVKTPSKPQAVVPRMETPPRAPGSEASFRIQSILSVSTKKDGSFVLSGRSMTKAKEKKGTTPEAKEKKGSTPEAKEKRSSSPASKGRPSSPEMAFPAGNGSAVGMKATKGKGGRWSIDDEVTPDITYVDETGKEQPIGKNGMTQAERIANFRKQIDRVNTLVKPPAASDADLIA